MLVKLHSREYSEDYGVLVNGSAPPHIHFFEHGIVRLGERMRPVPVVRVHAVWMEKDAKVFCDVADTDLKKQIGLQSCPDLAPDKGLYFPYPGRSDVAFHQGSVSYPLDVLFLRDDEIVKMEQNTKVGGCDSWSCKGCDGVIEVNGGFCEENDLVEGDRLVLFAYSMRDERDLKYEEASDNLIRENWPA